MKIPFGTEVGLGPSDTVLNGDSAPLGRGTAPLPHFSAHVYCGEMAGWIKMPLDTEVDLSPGHIVFNAAQLPPLKRGTAAPLSSTYVYCGQMVAHLSYGLLLSCCYITEKLA